MSSWNFINYIPNPRVRSRIAAGKFSDHKLVIELFILINICYGFQYQRQRHIVHICLRRTETFLLKISFGIIYLKNRQRHRAWCGKVLKYELEMQYRFTVLKSTWHSSQSIMCLAHILCKYLLVWNYYFSKLEFVLQ